MGWLRIFNTLYPEFKLKGMVIRKNMKSGIVIVLLLLTILSVKANNVRILKEADIPVTSIADNIALINMDIAWDNSWRDDFNWDAVYIFLKYKRKTETAWKHVYLMDGGHRMGASDIEFQMAKSDTEVNKCMGIFVQRAKAGSGTVKLSLQLRWLITKNGLDPVDFMNDNVEYQASCIEMVYMPMGAFCLGDGISDKTFQRNYRPILAEWDCLSSDTTQMSYWASGNSASEAYKKYPPENAVNRINNNNDLANTWMATAAGESIWQVDFKDKPKVIRYFGVSGLNYGGYQNYRPSTWELRAKNEGTGWVTVWSGDQNSWYLNNNSYPVQYALEVDMAKSGGKAYRYYQIHIITSGYPVVANNIAMTEVDLKKMTNDAFVIDRASGIVMDMETNLSAAETKEDGNTWSGTLQANYPTGFNSFYAMKYEISQEQWVRFLNKLEYNQQKMRTVGDKLDGLTVGKYVYGGTGGISCRNGIAIGSRDNGAVVFVNNLTNDANNEFAQPDDGQTIACNYLSPADMLAYADWCGLRPLSEMEYEKMARPPYPEIPILREWAGGDPAYLVKPISNSLSQARTSEERMNSLNSKQVNVNAGGALEGPTRVGCMAVGAQNRTDAGAGFWGCLDLSGNLSEIYYACTNGAGRNFSDILASHGNGAIVANSTTATAGNTDMTTSYWPQTPGSFILRGGNFKSSDNKLAISDRSGYGYFTNMNVKDSLVTFRLGHSVSKLETAATAPKTFLTLVNGVKSTTDGSAKDSVCSEAPYLIRGTDITTLPEYDKGRYSYIWYKSEDKVNWVILLGEESCNLTYRDFYNASGTPTSVYFKRRTQTSAWTDETFPVEIKVINTGYSFNRLKDTITIANHSLGYWVDTKTNARFVWKWHSATGDVMLHATQGQSVYDFYAPLRRQFNGKNGEDQRLVCEMNFMGRCVKKQELSLHIEARPTSSGVPSTAIAINAADPKNECGAMMKDSRSGVQLYKTVRIGDQCWMAENLRYPMPNGLSKFSDKDPNGEITGAYYFWNADVHASACPAGWRIPNDADFNKLKNYVVQQYGGDAGIHLKQGAYWNYHAGKQYLGDNKAGLGLPGTGNYVWHTSFENYHGTDGLGNYYMNGGYMCDMNDRYGWVTYSSKDFGWSYHWSWPYYYFPIRCIKQ